MVVAEAGGACGGGGRFGASTGFSESGFDSDGGGADEGGGFNSLAEGPITNGKGVLSGIEPIVGGGGRPGGAGARDPGAAVVGPPSVHQLSIVTIGVDTCSCKGRSTWAYEVDNDDKYTC